MTGGVSVRDVDVSYANRSLLITTNQSIANEETLAK